MGENEPPAVDDVWKASAYGDLEKLTRYIDAVSYTHLTLPTILLV